MAIQFLSEAVSARLISSELAMQAVEAAYIAVIDPQCNSFTVLRAHAHDSLNRFSVKSAATESLTGLKIGTYWHRNSAEGRRCHGSSILLFNQDTGELAALIVASEVNGYRTAAGNALATAKLARENATCLAIFGAGHQALFECQAVARVRTISRVLIVNRNIERANQLAARLRETWPNRAQIDVTCSKDACEQADIIVTATGSNSPLFTAQSVRPGTHISCMGADAVGKQEIPPELLCRAELYCDYLPQSTTIGEFQHISESILNGSVRATNLGEVLLGRHSGRESETATTVFDSSGLALQDLFIGQSLLREAERHGLVATMG
jgi:ornithine cyclodeaminase